MMTKEIPLTQGKVAIVDAADYEWLMRSKWYARRIGHLWYACRKGYNGVGKRVTVLLHRAILDAPSGIQVDHANGDGLDNRRENLRFATALQNHRNRKVSRNNKSGFKGVHWDGQARKWRATIYVDGRQLHLGNFDDLIVAATARDIASIKYHGEFARLNFPGAVYA